MEEEKIQIMSTLPPTKQECPLMTWSLIINSSCTLPSTTLLTSKVTTRTSWEEKNTRNMQLLHLPRLDMFLNDDLVMVGSGEVKKMEDVNTADFIKASFENNVYCVALGEVIDIEILIANHDAKIIVKQAKQEDGLLVCPVDKPFFVFCKGWASLFPLLTKQNYGLACKMLSKGDTIMVAITKKKCISFPMKDKIKRQGKKRKHENYKDEQPIDLSLKRHNILFSKASN